MGRKSWRIVVLMLVLMVLAGCGQKGPLYRETPEEQGQAQARQAPTAAMTAPLCNEYAARLG